MVELVGLCEELFDLEDFSVAAKIFAGVHHCEDLVVKGIFLNFPLDVKDFTTIKLRAQQALPLQILLDDGPLATGEHNRRSYLGQLRILSQLLVAANAC